MKILRNKYLLFLLGCFFLFGIWTLVSVTVDVNSMIFPSPINTIKLMVKLLGKKETYGYLAFSVIRLVIGFFISLLLAFLIGIIVNNNDALYNFFSPIITFFKAAPTATFVFLFLVLVGGRYASSFVVITVTFPILYESIVGALRSTSKNVIEAAKIDGASKIKSLFKIQLPLGIPFISLGIASTFGLAFKIEIMAEVISGITRGGIGTMINISQLLNATDLTPMFAYSLMAIILVLIINFVTQILKSKLHIIQPIKHRDINKI